MIGHRVEWFTPPDRPVEGNTIYVRPAPAEDASHGGASSAHEYLSTGCFHGEHGYCASMVGAQGAKRPSQCKFCDAQCKCPCHRGVADRRGG